MLKGSIQPGLERGKVLVCPACGSKFTHDLGNGQKALKPFCPNHPQIHPTRFRVMWGNICHHHKNFETAEMELLGFRHEHNLGKFDVRDYQNKNKPLAFSCLVDKWLDIKSGQIKEGSLRAIICDMRRAQNAWGEINIKSIGYPEIEEFLKAHPGAQKTKANCLASLKQFFAWVHDRFDILPIKKWPKLGYIEMAFRNTIDLVTQESIINDIKLHEPFKIWLCIKWLATYIAIRPGEMCSLTEINVDRKQGLLIVPHPKEKRAKIIPLVPVDIDLVRSLPIAFNQAVPFFQTSTGAFGPRACYRAWNRSCKRLRVEGVTLYPGTKHSTAMGLRAVATPEEIKSMTLHRTSSAFNRYFQTGGSDLRNLLSRRESALNADNGLTTDIKQGNQG